jgi:methyltransferase (TIGR00027 family)
MALDREVSDRNARSTAEGAAAFRAAGARERDRKVRNPDRYAGRFLGWRPQAITLARVPGVRRLIVRRIEQLLPGAYPFETARTLYMDQVVRDEVGAGARQLVLLGAGYDSRAYRMRELLDGVRIFEVDHPVTSELKRRRLVKIFGRVPSHVAYVRVDFEHEDLGEKLVEGGYDPGLRAIFLLAGVAPYLEEAAVRELLTWVGEQAPGSAIAFDYMWTETLASPEGFYGAPELMDRVASIGEALQSGIPRGRTAEYLADFGLEVDTDLGPEAAQAWLTRSDGSLLGRSYGFGGVVLARVAA